MGEHGGFPSKQRLGQVPAGVSADVGAEFRQRMLAEFRQRMLAEFRGGRSGT